MAESVSSRHRGKTFCFSAFYLRRGGPTIYPDMSQTKIGDIRAVVRTLHDKRVCGLQREQEEEGGQVGFTCRGSPLA